MTDLEINEIFNSLTDSLGDYEKYYNQYKFDCPNCDEGNKKNLECNSVKKFFNCWSCGYKGHLSKLFKKYAPQVIYQYKDYFKIDNTLFSNDEKKLVLPKTIPYFKNKIVKSYLENTRGIDAELLLERKVRFVEDSEEKLYKNIIYPFYKKSELIGSCVYNIETGKYKNLTPLNFVPYEDFIDKYYPVTLTEGVIDCLSAINAIPMCGTTVNSAICEFLYGCKVIVAHDTKVKLSHTIELLEMLNKYNIKEVEIFNLNGYEDINDYYLKDKESYLNEYKRLYKILN